MKLQKKVLYSLAVVAFLFIIIVGVISSELIIRSFGKVEELDATRGMEQVTNLISKEILDLKEKCVDWAEWDDTYYFIQGENEKYAEDNLGPDTLKSLRLNFFIILDDSGKTTLSEAFDLGKDEKVQFPKEIRDVFERIIIEQRESLKNKEKSSGIIKTEKAPLMYIILPVTKNDRSLPSKGWLIFARYLDKTETDYLSQIIQIPIEIIQYDPEKNSEVKETERLFKKENFITLTGNTVYKIDGEEAQTELIKTRSLILPDKKALIVPKDKNTLVGYAKIFDINQNPVAIVKIETNRAIHNEGIGSAIVFIVLLIIGVFALAVALKIILERTITNRIEKLEEEIKKIETEKNQTKSVSVSGDDEIADLARTTNLVLERIRNATKIEKSTITKLEQKNEELEKFSNTTTARELRMIQLKQEVNELCEKLGEKPRYQSQSKK
jgi:sensor domain CHASE-containing protein